MTAELLKIAEEIDHKTWRDHPPTGQILNAWAARIRAAVSPEAVAFNRAARELVMAWISADEYPQKSDVFATSLLDAGRAMLAAEERNRK